MIRGLNHITLAVSNLPRAIDFYSDVLGLAVNRTWESGAYLSVGALWLCLSLDETAKPSADYTHIAFDVAEADFAETSRRIQISGAPIWKDNRSEGASLYFRDPEGHKLELHAGSLETRLAAMTKELETC